MVFTKGPASLTDSGTDQHLIGKLKLLIAYWDEGHFSYFRKHQLAQDKWSTEAHQYSHKKTYRAHVNAYCTQTPTKTHTVGVLVHTNTHSQERRHPRGVNLSISNP